ncbi:MAG: hypothetical protein AAF267_16875 [Deinococcota bacterium]
MSETKTASKTAANTKPKLNNPIRVRTNPATLDKHAVFFDSESKSNIGNESVEVERTAFIDEKLHVTKELVQA